MNQYDIIIIGGGPAGLFTAITAASKNKKILILEKNNQCGKKLLLSGSGKCNLTQAGDIHNFFNHYGNNHRFLKHALLTFTNESLMSFFKKRGIKFTIEDTNKVFPSNMKAESILYTLLEECKKNNITIITNSSVENINKEDNYFLIETNNSNYKASNVVIATGGITYPITGSTGDGQKLAKKLGHKIIPMKPALTPLMIKNYNLADLAGLSFTDIQYTLWRNNKKIGDYQGDFLLTHKGISGPAILNNSRDMYSGDIIKINFTKQPIQTFRENFIKQINSNGKNLIKTIIKQLDIPKRLIDKILELSQINEDITCATLKKEQRQALIILLTEYEMTIKELGNINIAMATSGGVSLKDIQSKTMESRKIENLYFVGEAIDIDGDTGGYNLQAAFSTAYICGLNLKIK